MFIDNKIIVLISIHQHRDENNIVSFRQLQDSLSLEKSHISQSLKHNEQQHFIQKPNEQKYFSYIQITPLGIKKAQFYIDYLQELLQNHQPPPKIQKSISKKSPIPSTFHKFLKEFPSTLFTPLKNTVKESLQQYIPESNLGENLLDDLSEDILDFFQKKLSTLC